MSIKLPHSVVQLAELYFDGVSAVVAISGISGFSGSFGEKLSVAFSSWEDVELFDAFRIMKSMKNTISADRIPITGII